MHDIHQDPICALATANGMGAIAAWLAHRKQQQKTEQAAGATQKQAAGVAIYVPPGTPVDPSLVVPDPAPKP